MKVLKNKNIYLSISGIFFMLSVFLILIPKLNFGIDMTGGIKAEYSYILDLNMDKLRKNITEKSKKVIFDNKEVINSTNLYKISGEDKIVITAGFDNKIEGKSLNSLKINFREQVLKLLQAEDKNIEEVSYTNIGKSFGDYIKNTAIVTLIIAIIAITIYVTYSFSSIVLGISVISFSIITIITLFHDVIISSGLYIMVSMFFPEFKINTFFVTALLTILGYSINDTIVIFDRIRSNLKEFGGKIGKKGKTLKEIIDLSVNETLKRSIYTSLTLLFVLLTIFIFGPETIKGFILVMIFGTIVGTYSSIFVASPILYLVNRHKKLSVYKKIKLKAEDKIVV